MPVDLGKVEHWLRRADAIFQTPLVAMMVIPLLKQLAPSLGLTEAQIAQLDAHYADLERREAEALRRSRLDG
jgi:hypothetical protein